MNRRIASVLMLTSVLGLVAGLGAWKYNAIRQANAASAQQPEPAEAVTAAVARELEHRQAATAIGTVLALRSVMLRNELAGTVRHVRLNPGEVVEPGTVLVALDVSVEEAELKAQEAQAALARTTLERHQRLHAANATTEIDLDRARAERDVALAQIARTKAIIARKTIRAPFKARVGIADLHVGQYLNEGAELTTLQSVADAVHVDFTLPQDLAHGLHTGDRVQIFANGDATPIDAGITALDARVDPATRSTTVRARVERGADLAPGASVRVKVAVGATSRAVAIPASALRKGPGGDHVFVLAADDQGRTRARLRAVQAGTLLGDEVLINSGLAAGEQVAASGSFKLRDAAIVAVAQARTASGS